MIEKVALTSVSYRFGLHKDLITHKHRRCPQKVLRARIAYCTLLKMKTKMTLKEIGKGINVTDHSQIIYYLTEGGQLSKIDIDFEFKLIKCFNDLNEYFKIKNSYENLH